MKKYLFIILAIFIFIFTTDSVFALSYSVNDKSYNVVDSESYRDYCYYTYFKNSNYKEFSFHSFYGNGVLWYYCTFFNENLTTSYKNNSNVIYYSSNGNKYNIFNKYTSDFINEYGGNLSNRISYASWNDILFTTFDIKNNDESTIWFSSSSVNVIEDKYSQPIEYTIIYYLNNQVYNTFNVREGSSHTLLYYQPSNEYNFSGWTYDNNIDLTNIQSNVAIYGTTTLKPYYTITYYLNNNVYDTIQVMEGTNYTLASYVPPRNYNFSGWTYDNNIDLTNIQSNVDIIGTTTYVRPSMNYNENTDSIIHNISYQILGNSIPVEFDFLYTFMDFIILIIIICCVIAPFLILIKLLGGRF